MSDSVSRRALIKSAAAAGVGVAAWSAPTISALGVTPAYAAVCSTPIQYFVSNEQNVNCSCGSSTKFLDYHSPITDFHLGTDASGPAVTGFKVEITSGANFACSDVSTPVTVTTNPPNLVCEVCVVIVGSPAAGTYCSAPGAGAALPQTNSLGNASNCGSTKYYVQLRCVPQGSCFPT